jgi:hypothetical protein
MLVHVPPDQQAEAKYALLESDGKVDEVAPGIFEVTAASHGRLTGAGIAVTQVVQKSAPAVRKKEK